MPARKDSPKKSRPARNAIHRGPRDERGVVAARILTAARASFATHGYRVNLSATNDLDDTSSLLQSRQPRT
jgi:hypothetical protein